MDAAQLSLPTPALPAIARAGRPSNRSGAQASRAWPGRAGARPVGLGVVLALHLLAAGLLWRGVGPAAAPRPELIVVRWVAPFVPPAPPAAAAPSPAEASARVRPAPAIPPAAARLDRPAATPTSVEALAIDSAQRAALNTSIASAPPGPAPVALQAAAPRAFPAAAPPAPAPPVSLDAPRYLVEPRLHLPLASRRLGEQGLVQLRLHIGTAGELLAASLARSSGFERLDAQALRDIRSARFSAVIEAGRAVEWECLALLSYEISP